MTIFYHLSAIIPGIIELITLSIRSRLFYRETNDLILKQLLLTMEAQIPPLCLGGYKDQIKIIKQQNQGALAVRNRGLQESTG